MDTKASFDRIYKALSLMEMVYVDDAEDIKLTYRDILYINIIMMTPGCTVSNLAETLRVSLPTVTRRLNSMEERGLIVKKRQMYDARYKTITLSDSLKLAIDMENSVVDTALGKLDSAYTEEQIQMFCEMMDFVADHMQEAIEERRNRRSKAKQTFEAGLFDRPNDFF